MSLKKLYQWVKQCSKEWTGTTRHFRANVALFSRGVVLAQSSQLRKISGCVGGKADSQRRRLQRFVKGDQPLKRFFTGWTRSVLSTIRPPVAVLIVDETKLRDEWGMMVVGLAYQARCIPLAWACYRANRAAEYPAEGQVGLILGLLEAIRAGVPAGQRVRVLADRGIGTSPDLMRGIMALGWTFLFRVTRQSKIILPDGSEVTFYDQVQQPGATYQAEGLVFKKRGRVPAAVRVLWGLAAKERWSLVTNAPALSGWEYADRMWAEESFRDLKSQGWQVEDTTFDDPQRMARLWIFLVVAYAWMLLIGAALLERGWVSAPKRRSTSSSVRQWSLFREGRNWFLNTSPPFRR